MPHMPYIPQGYGWPAGMNPAAAPGFGYRPSHSNFPMQNAPGFGAPNFNYPASKPIVVQVSSSNSILEASSDSSAAF
jgi:hypothetical protein